MFSYQISFTSKEIDESALRRAIEAAAGVKDISIRRQDGPASSPQGVASVHNSKSGDAILAVLRQHPWMKSIDLIKACEPIPASTVRRQIFDLHRNGQIFKICHGVYTVDPNVTHEQIAVAKKDTSRKASSVQSYLNTLGLGPKTAVELRSLFGVTRQRVEQVLSRLMKSGLVERHETDNEAGQYVYCLPSQRAIIRSRDIRLRPSKARLISLLLPDKIYLTTDVASLVGSPTTPIRASMDALVRSGLVNTFKINSRHFVYLTPDGLSHADYDPKATKCQPVNFIDLIGTIRASFIEILDVLGDAQTFDLTCCIGVDAFSDKCYASGQTIQRLRMDGIIQIKTKDENKHARYELTRLGQYIAAIITRYREPPKRDDLLVMIENGKREKQAKLAIANGARFSEDGLTEPLASTYRGILTVLRVIGDCSTPNIVVLMEPKFANPRSIHLAMRTLLERGLVRRSGRDPRSGAAIWAITDDGCSRLDDSTGSVDAAGGQTEAA